MKIIKILGIAAGLHALALILIFSNPGCTYTKAAAPDTSPIASAPMNDAAAPAPAPASSDSPTIRYSPTRPGTPVASALESPPVSGVTPATTYTVARGDSLWSIAKANQLTRGDIATANNLGANATLHVGQKLIIPSKPRQSAGLPAASAPSVGAAVSAPASAPPEKSSAELERHVVKAGETLGGIARKYGVRQGDIAVANNITDPKKIQPGQELVIPARSAATGKQAKAAKPSAADAAKPPATAAIKPAAAPGGTDQDLDAGLKPPSAADVPVVKIEDSPTATQPKNP
jgi:LysM repeat protein